MVFDLFLNINKVVKYYSRPHNLSVQKNFVSILGKVGWWERRW